MTSLRYVVLHHQGIAQPHFDFMFETAPGSKLATFRAPRWPIDESDSLERLGEHRRDYLDYEGPLSNNRGHVKRVDSGKCTLTELADEWIVELQNGRVIRLPLRA